MKDESCNERKLDMAIMQLIKDKLSVGLPPAIATLIAKKTITQLRDTDPSIPFLGIKSLAKFEELKESEFCSSGFYGNSEEYRYNKTDKTDIIEHTSIDTMGVIFLSIDKNLKCRVFTFWDIEDMPTRVLINSGDIYAEDNIIDRDVNMTSKFKDLCKLTYEELETTEDRVCVFKVLSRTTGVTTIKPFLKFFKKKSYDVTERYAYIQAMTMHERPFVKSAEIDNSDLNDRVCRLESIIGRKPANGLPSGIIVMDSTSTPPPEIQNMLVGIGIDWDEYPTQHNSPKEPKPLKPTKKELIENYFVEKMEFLIDDGVPDELYEESLLEINHLLGNEVIVNNITEASTYFGGIDDEEVVKLVDVYGKYYSRFVSQIKHVNNGEIIPYKVPVKGVESYIYIEDLPSELSVDNDSQISAVVLIQKTDKKDPNIVKYTLMMYVFANTLQRHSSKKFDYDGAC